MGCRSVTDAITGIVERLNKEVSRMQTGTLLYCTHTFSILKRRGVRAVLKIEISNLSKKLTHAVSSTALAQKRLRDESLLLGKERDTVQRLQESVENLTHNLDQRSQALNTLTAEKKSLQDDKTAAQNVSKTLQTELGHAHQSAAVSDQSIKDLQIIVEEQRSKMATIDRQYVNSDQTIKDLQTRLVKAQRVATEDGTKATQTIRTLQTRLEEKQRAALNVIEKAKLEAQTIKEMQDKIATLTDKVATIHHQHSLDIATQHGYVYFFTHECGLTVVNSHLQRANEEVKRSRMSVTVSVQHAEKLVARIKELEAAAEAKECENRQQLVQTPCVETQLETPMPMVRFF